MGDAEKKRQTSSFQQAALRVQQAVESQEADLAPGVISESQTALLGSACAGAPREPSSMPTVKSREMLARSGWVLL